jgi:hypothetical protein
MEIRVEQRVELIGLFLHSNLARLKDVLFEYTDYPEAFYTPHHLRCRSAVPWLRWLVAGLKPRRPEFTPGLYHVGFVLDKVALG